MYTHVRRRDNPTKDLFVNLSEMLKIKLECIKWKY